ncbi:Predicted PurR-regulated permease PerM [Rhodococcus triatomae]|uniref:Predicted PurR-regulated permease PerM n=1 Tax=Rhodococcus triatomae TaxID=300028 RepID=A0A1G8GQH6_9NOCA|nr:AI-2E family transporter [Rhodococcus triatomae]SDH96617.1 Predicted PurR-regulated permease PerM [Rhodococcus triatomae]
MTANEYPASPAPAADAVHPIVRVAAEWTWRLLILFAGVVVVGYLVAKFDTVTVPVALALLGSALLTPAVDRLQRWGLTRGVSVALVLVAALGVVAAILAFVVEQFVVGFPGLADRFADSIGQIQSWLTAGPFHFSNDQIHHAGESVVQAVQSNREALTSGALTTAGLVGEIVTGAFLTLFTLIFFLYGGRQIWEFVTRIVPHRARGRVRLAGTQGFASLTGYVRATVAVAAVDAVGIGAGLVLLGVPLALPLASLVFLGAFVPIVGAFLAGFLAVLVALVAKGLLTALLVLGIIIAVMQLEAHVLQPLLLGRAVRLHPLAVVLAITTGIVLAGIVGGLLAVPVVAVLDTAVRSLLSDDPEAAVDEIEVDDPSVPLYPARPDEPDEPEDSDDSDQDSDQDAGK